jgi:hypothetical protein
MSSGGILKKPNKTINICIIVNSTRIPKWQYNSILSLHEKENIRISSFIIDGTNHPPRISYLSIYSRLEKRFVPFSNDPLEPVDMGELIDRIDEVRTIETNSSLVDGHFSFDEKDIEALGTMDLDLYINFNPPFYKGGIFDTCRLGMLTLNHGDIRNGRGYPPGFWELLNREPITWLELIYSNKTGSRILYRTNTNTQFHSLNTNDKKLYLKSQTYFDRGIRIIEDMTNGEDDLIDIGYKDLRKPGLIDKTRFTLRMSRNIARRYFDYYFNEKRWSLYYKFTDDIMGIQEAGGLKKIEPPRDRFWADPFILCQDDLYHIYFEDYPYKDRIGNISHITIDDEGIVSDPRIVLKGKYHLSFPFIMKYDGGHYMIPECRRSRKIDVYKCEDFPYEWKRHKTIMKNIDAVDTTILEHEGQWWMFTSIDENRSTGTSGELHLFRSNEPFSGYEPFHSNPVIADIRKARNAGKVFISGNEMIRPSQDCSVRYGYRININRVEELDVHNYRESVLAKLNPDIVKGLKGIHTLNYENGLLIIDGYVQ